MGIHLNNLPKPRFDAKGCFLAHSVVVAPCSCGCGVFQILFLDETETVRAAAGVSLDKLRGVMSQALGGVPTSMTTH